MREIHNVCKFNQMKINEYYMNKLIITVIILFAALSRLIPHPPNFTPIIAIGLFGGAYLKDLRIAILIPLCGMIISDLILGFHEIMPWVYLSLTLITFLGLRLKNRVNFVNCLIAVLGGSLIFFLLSNFGVWFMGGYEKTISGLIVCYTMAIPFLNNTLIGSAAYGVIMFGGYEALKYFLPSSAPDSI